jgi:hypothetical protein
MLFSGTTGTKGGESRDSFRKGWLQISHSSHMREEGKSRFMGNAKRRQY